MCEKCAEMVMSDEPFDLVFAGAWLFSFAGFINVVYTL